MKKIIFPILASVCILFTLSLFAASKGLKSDTISISESVMKFDIKIKNDSGDEVSVINAGSGGTYRLTKNAVTTIKMEEGDKLFMYDGGKKGKLLLTATSEMDGKVQMFSKL